MSIVGFNFSKILVQRTKQATGKVNIKNNIQLKDVEEAKLAIDAKKAALRFTFSFTSIYEPDIAKIELEGELISIEDASAVKELLASWKKSRTLDKKFMNPIMNHLLAKCNVEALILSKELGLPAPIPLPRIQEQETIVAPAQKAK